MELIPNWTEQNLTCYFCGSTKSVKYKLNLLTIDSLPGIPREAPPKKVCTCNKCALIFQEQARAIDNE